VLVALEPGRAARPTERERDAEELGPAREEGEIEAEEVVVLEDVGIALPDQRAELLDQAALLGGLAGLAGEGEAPAVAHRGKEDPLLVGIEPRRLEIDLHPVEIVVVEAAEIHPPGGHQVLLDRADPVIPGELDQAADRPREPPRGSGEEGPG